MTMPLAADYELIRRNCHNCGKRHRLTQRSAGKPFRCRKCGMKLTAPIPTPVKQAPSAPRRRSLVLPLAIAFGVIGLNVISIAAFHRDALPVVEVEPPVVIADAEPEAAEPPVEVAEAEPESGPEPEEPEVAAPAPPPPSPTPAAPLALPVVALATATGFPAALKLADAGNANAMYRVGLAYEKGEGVEKDYEAAAAWYEEAANLGHGAAMGRLGNLYEEGDGVEKDYQTAMEWLMAGAAAGDPFSMNGVGRFYDIGKGVTQDFHKAAEWYEKAAAVGYAAAMRNLAILYENGQGVKQDKNKAIEWYTKAAKAGNADAVRDLERLRDEGEETASAGSKSRYRSQYEPWRNFNSAGDARQRDNFIRGTFKGGLPNQMPGARPR
jgi:TPR repeat protein